MLWLVRDLDGVVLRWPTANSRRWVETFLGQAALDQNIRAVVAVGSSIRVDVRTDDLDLVVLCRDRELFRYKAPIEVDVRAFPVADVDDSVGSGHDLLGWAVKFGQVLLDRDDTWCEITRRWAHRVPLPDPALARARARTALGHLRRLEEVGDEAAAAEFRVSYLTLLARACLAEHGVYPISRPELADQLRAVGEFDLAERLDSALATRAKLAPTG